jgi:hypothetical protein
MPCPAVRNRDLGEVHTLVRIMYRRGRPMLLSESRKIYLGVDRVGILELEVERSGSAHFQAGSGSGWWKEVAVVASSILLSAAAEGNQPLSACSAGQHTAEPSSIDSGVGLGN